MGRVNLFVALFLCVFSYCYSEIGVEEKDRFLNGFVDYLNNLPTQPYIYDDGVLLSAQKTDESSYNIETRVRATEIHNIESVRYLKCTATIVDHQENRISVNQDYVCEDAGSNNDISVGHYEEVVPDPSTVEPPVQQRPVQLDNEVRPNTETTSGEQFVAIPREEPIQRGHATCIGCASRINPEAPGVSDLAAVGIKQLDRHEPNIRHSLNRVIDVERQVQVVNGVRYILTLLVNYNNCTEAEIESCSFIQPCKISVLEKPWLKLPSGGKYRAIVANNCTEKWLFGDNGELVPEKSDENKEDNDINYNIDADKAKDFVKPTPGKIAETGAEDDILIVIQNADLQSQQKQKSLSVDEIKKIEEQIIPNDKFEHSTMHYGTVIDTSSNADISKQHKVEVESANRYRDNLETETHSGYTPSSISEDNKKAIDGLMSFFNFAGYNSDRDRRGTRMKRSFDYDLQILSLANKFNKIKNNIKNAKYIYSVAQSMIDYLNEMDMKEKGRILKDVVTAEEESNNEQNYMYLQARVVLLCEKTGCESKDTMLCNGVIDTTHTHKPQILTAFCYDEKNKMLDFGKVHEISPNDPVLQKLINQAVKKIESESPYNNAMKVIKIINANTQKVSGTLTKISAALAYTNCNRTIIFSQRRNCTVLEFLGMNLCDIDILERHRLKEIKITYMCTERPLDESFTNTYQITKSIENTNNPQIVEMVEDALQYLEIQSNRNNKQKIVEVKSVSTQVFAGLLTTIEFIVGYTKCNNENDVNDNECNILENEKLRSCRAQIWQRPWLEDGKQINVTCEDDLNLNDNNIGQNRKKRSINFVGGKQTQDTKNPRYLQLVEKSLKKYLQTSGITQKHKIVKVDKVTVQVVSGTLTSLDFTVIPETQNSDDVIKCHSEVWEQSWLNKTEIDVQCQIDNTKLRNKRQIGITGGQVEKDPNDSRYKKLAHDSLQKYLQTSGITKKHKIDKVDKVTVQVVSGTLTRLDFTVIPETQNSGDVIKCHSEVWEQSWLNNTEINVQCQIDNAKFRNKRQTGIPGGQVEKDPNDSRYNKLAHDSLQKYLQTSGITEKHKIVKVDKVTVQVVSGTLTRLDFTVIPETQHSGDVIKCHSEVWEQPWLNKTEIDVQCQIDNAKLRNKRQTGIPGGQVEKDPNDSRYKKLAHDSLQKYLQTSGITEKHKIDKVDKVTVQVVSGTLTRLDFTVIPETQNSGDVIKCHSKVWEQPWLNKTEIDVECQIDNAKLRNKRQTGIRGGQVEKDPNDSRYKKLAHDSLQKYLQTSGITEKHKIDKVDKVTVQVVSGTLTRLDFTVIPETQNSGDVIKCHSKVWEQPWLNKTEIDVECQIDNAKLRNKRQTGIRGGQVEKDPNDSRYKKLAHDSLQKYLQTSGITEKHKIVKVDKVTVQVVSGTLTRLDFTVIPETQHSGDVIKCHSEVWEQPWLNKTEIDVQCQIDNAKLRNKRQTGIPGGQVEKDPNDSRYKKLAHDSLQKYLQTSGITEKHKIDKVDKVTVQVVSGTLTRLDFTVIPETQNSGDVIKCHSKVWEQPWLNKTEIDVECQIDNAKLRNKRQTGIPGGQVEKDPNDSRYKKLAHDSLQKYLQTSGITEKHKIDKVDKVTVQVVSGTLTRLDFTVIPETQNPGDVIKCHSKVWEQPWLNKTEIDVECQIDNAKLRNKRQTGIPGGQVEKDPNDSRYKKLAHDSLQKYLQTSGITKKHKIVKVDKVTVQVVSGTLTRLDFTVIPETQNSGDVIKCHSEVWEQSWLNKTVIDVQCQIDNAKLRNKRQSGLPGGQVEKYPNDPYYKKLADESLQKYLQTSGITQQHEVVNVNKVTVQVVSGTLTKLDFIASPDSQNLEDVIKCESKVWEKPWLHFKEITVTCQINDEKSRPKRKINEKSHVKGGKVHKNPTDPQYKSLAEASLRKYQRLQKNNDKYLVIEVKNVIEQAVDGIICEIGYIAKQISCAANAIHNSACKQFKNETLLICHTKILMRRSVRDNDIDVYCNADTDESSSEENVLSTHKSSKLGGIQEQDVNEESYVIMVEKAIRQYEQSSKTKYRHELVEIHKVTQQVVAGLITEIDFTIAPTTCLLEESSSNSDCSVEKLKHSRCHVKIWDKPGRSQNMRVSCRGGKTRRRRQLDVGENDVDEDMKYYYAERAVQQINDHSDTDNLHKLISIHDMHVSTHMNTPLVRMFLEIALTYCLRHQDDHDLNSCDEMNGLNHKLCHARLYPSPDDELIVQQVSVVCDDDPNFSSVTGLSVPELLKASIKEIEKSPDIQYKMVHQGEPYVIPSLDSTVPIKMSFVVAYTNCSKYINIHDPKNVCFIDTLKSSMACHSSIYMTSNSREIERVIVSCKRPSLPRLKRSITLNNERNVTRTELDIQNLVNQALEKLEMVSLHRYKQRVLKINSFSSKLTSGKVTTIDFDVGYTACLKYEWVENIASCQILEHLPRRHCIAEIYERLWINNGKNIDVNCEDDETFPEAHIEFENAELAMQLAKQALKHVEAKYPHPREQKVVRIFTLEKQVVAGLHYRLKMEVGFTNCTALSNKRNCVLVTDSGLNKFCRVNVWIRPWTDHAPNFRVSCDYQDNLNTEIHHQIQAEHLFYDFLATYKPEYVNDHVEMMRRYKIFEKNVEKIHFLNTHERGTATYAVTQFADLSYEEFTSKYLGLKPSLKNGNHIPMSKAAIPNITIPDDFDWRDHNAVTEVKNQGSCGSCWAFSVIGNIEGQWKMQSGELVSLSEQELVDCDKIDEGCNGGLPDNAYRAIEELGGLELEKDYPYEGEDDKCAFNKSLARVQISGAVNISSNETDMAKWLVQNGPISIGINANAMQFYVGGVSHPWKMLCNPKNLDHGVLIVGFGVKDYPLFHKHLPFWTIKNSWGKSWGEQGYYRVYRGDGTCGVNQMASSAII